MSAPTMSTYTQSYSIANGTDSCVEDSTLRLPLAIFYSIFFVFGLLGNALALWVFIFVHGKKNSVRVFLINIAMADLLLVACLPFRVVYHSIGNHWALGPVMCKVVGNVFYMNMYISITLLGFISVDRYIKIHRGSSRRLLSSCWSTLVCGTIWTLSITAIIPMIVLSEGNEEKEKCFQYKHRRHAKGKAYFNLVMVVIFWLIFLLLVISYGKIAMKLLEASKKKPDLPNAIKYNRTAKKSFFVLFLFTICFCPYHVFRIFYIHSQITESSCHVKSIMDKTNEVVLLLSTFNSCLDPVMYFLLSASVRKATMRMLGNFFQVQEISGNSSSTELRRASLPQVSSTPRNSISLLITQRCKASPNSYQC
ncbi:probable G-protein coupled receptor 34 [Brienomyrus brachyistius]|uniref:probable G-protein coupled receptor 34 n=1 Tax=Brienomyrus brachyistius TaxID=42636 RepID=UPI0020B447A7|nr:probable G-protein coupled receptor 34 [Brienomyrus brachyistius]